MYKISAQSDVVVKSYRVNGRTDTLTDSIVYSLFEYKKMSSRHDLTLQQKIELINELESKLTDVYIDSKTNDIRRLF